MGTLNHVGGRVTASSLRAVNVVSSPTEWKLKVLRCAATVEDYAGTAAERRPRPIEVWTFDVGNETASSAQGDNSCGSGRVMVR
jgi:hypothetical protein